MSEENIWFRRITLKHLANISLEDAIKVLAGELKAINDDMQELLNVIDSMKGDREAGEKKEF